jgi:ornithine cyclodeaminase
MGLMPGWRGQQEDKDAAFVLKAICIIPGNPARGLDAHQGLVTLFDGETGVPTAILDASAVTAIRTAAVTAVATGLLARDDARTLAILGAGVQARSHLRALANVRDFEQVRVYAPTAAHARAVVEEAAVARGELSVATSAEEAVRGADVVVAVTNSPEPVLQRAWLTPGAHVNAVGASTLRTRELDSETVAASALFCDSRESLRNEAGEFARAVAEGAIPGEEHIRAELGEVLAGMAPGRRDGGELTLFRSLGVAIEDLAAAERAVATARERGIGIEVEL